ncbi:hypothetical protein KORDIASMS9_01683 [Kordia sp. SMS9]|nr:hypothetical protein KORDIASMS9_01683 [Kordia sp. SMS9]
MKKRNLRLLNLNKKSISNFKNEALKGGMSRSQCDSACGNSCTPALCKAQ